MKRFSPKGSKLGMSRGHVWTRKAFPATGQEEVLLAAGAPLRSIYVDNIDAFIKSLRTDDHLVVDGFRGLGRDAITMLNNMKKVHAKHAAVEDERTGRLSTRKVTVKLLVEEAVKAVVNELRGPRKDRRRAYMPWDQVAKFYFDKLLKNCQIEAAVSNGYRKMSITTMWRHFGKRGGIVGRPSLNGR